MSCRLEIVSDHREIVGDDAVREFNEVGGTIGRSLQNDWILPDPDRYISGRHATIDHQGGIYYLLDTSTNGVYVNGDCEPVGKGNSRRLFNGDVLRFGDFEIVVSIEAGESIVMPLDDDVDPRVRDHAASVVPEDSLRTGIQLLDEEEITGDDEFQSALFGTTADSEIAKRAAKKVEERVAPLVEKSRPVDPKPLAEADLVATDLIDAFLDGLGLSRADLHPSADLAEIMQNAGEVMREFVKGATALLQSRANLKSAFRLDQTTVLPRHNNPMKLSANTRDTMLQLLVGKDGEYLGPRDAVREVCRDLLFHQDAFLDAMNSAFVEFADRFEPDELADAFNRNLSGNPLFKWSKKSKYWSMYCDLYPILTEKGSGRFPQMYAEEFVRAYERQIAEYKRLGQADSVLGDSGEHLTQTIKLTESQRFVAPSMPSEDEHEAQQLQQAQDDDSDDNAVDLADSAIDALRKLDELHQSSIEDIIEEDDFRETVAFEGASLDELPDDPADEAKG